MFGKPDEGSHALRDPIFGTALWDVIFTIIGAGAISWWKKYDFVMVLLVLFILGIIAHRVFCVRTTVDKLLFANPRD